jgi:hypothetical protein
MTCKDCIHCDVCSDWENICNKMSLFSTIKKEVCKDFKDKSKMMELTCKKDDILIRNGKKYVADHWNILLTAFAEDETSKSGYHVSLFSPEEAEQALRERELK